MNTMLQLKGFFGWDGRSSTQVFIMVFGSLFTFPSYRIFRPPQWFVVHVNTTDIDKKILTSCRAHQHISRCLQNRQWADTCELPQKQSLQLCGWPMQSYNRCGTRTARLPAWGKYCKLVIRLPKRYKPPKPLANMYSTTYQGLTLRQALLSKTTKFSVWICNKKCWALKN